MFLLPSHQSRAEAGSGTKPQQKNIPCHRTRRRNIYTLYTEHYNISTQYLRWTLQYFTHKDFTARSGDRRNQQNMNIMCRATHVGVDVECGFHGTKYSLSKMPTCTFTLKIKNLLRRFCKQAFKLWTLVNNDLYKIVEINTKFRCQLYECHDLEQSLRWAAVDVVSRCWSLYSPVIYELATVLNNMSGQTIRSRW